jgi:hypothetical protein
MRLSILSLFLITAAVIGESPVASAQSPNSYPWCARMGRDAAATSCYFTSYQQCRTTVSGVGGFCYQNPGFHGTLASAQTRSRHY